MTSSPAPIPRARDATCRDTLPFATGKAKRTPTSSAKRLPKSAPKD